MLEEIQAKEEEHADDLADLLRDLPKHGPNQGRANRISLHIGAVQMSGAKPRLTST
jgi:hypothetical protein